MPFPHVQRVALWVSNLTHGNSQHKWSFSLRKSLILDPPRPCQVTPHRKSEDVKEQQSLGNIQMAQKIAMFFMGKWRGGRPDDQAILGCPDVKTHFWDRFRHGHRDSSFFRVTGSKHAANHWGFHHPICRRTVVV